MNILENYRIAEEAYKRLIGKNNFYLKDDLIQEAVLRLIEKRHEYIASKAAYKTWAEKTATNCMLNVLIKNKRHLQNPSIFETTENGLCYDDIFADEQPTPCEESCNLAGFHKMAKTIAPLFAHANERDRRIIAMHLKHYTQTEIARALGISQPYVSIIVERFRAAAAILLGVNRREYKK